MLSCRRACSRGARARARARPCRASVACTALCKVVESGEPICLPCCSMRAKVGCVDWWEMCLAHKTVFGNREDARLCTLTSWLTLTLRSHMGMRAPTTRSALLGIAFVDGAMGTMLVVARHCGLRQGNACAVYLSVARTHASANALCAPHPCGTCMVCVSWCAVLCAAHSYRLPTRSRARVLTPTLTWCSAASCDPSLRPYSLLSPEQQLP